MEILFLVLFRPPDTETQRMVTMVRMTMSATTHDGAETQMEAQRVETLVTVALSATGSRWCRGIEKVGLDPLVQCATCLHILLACLQGGCSCSECCSE